MSHELLAPDEGTPPRTVFEWTTVIGHDITCEAGRPASCSCGERQPRNSPIRSSQWREEHLKNAWPVLVERLQDETVAEWERRLAVALAKAYLAQEELDEQLGLGGPVRAGQPYPVASEESIAAEQRVLVLQHQLEELRRRLGG